MSVEVDDVKRVLAICFRDGSTQTIDDLESDFKKLEDDGMVRCIAQNFTTQWYKIFDDVMKIKCPSCNKDIYLGKEESQICPNSDCNATL